jgi:hypothetical protein
MSLVTTDSAVTAQTETNHHAPGHCGRHLTKLLKRSSFSGRRHAGVWAYDEFIVEVGSRKGGPMALSEYEQRKLDEIERSLHSDHPTLATILDIGVVRRHRRIVAVAIFVGGFVALMAGAVIAQSLPVLGVVVSVLGFVAMFGGAGSFVSGRLHTRRAAGAGSGAGSHPGPSWRNRMEERFRGRFDRPGGE